MITLTEKAAFRLRTFLRSTPETANGIRVGLKDGGCSGYEYTLEIVNQAHPDDLVFEQDRIYIYVNPTHAPLLQGVVIDFAESLTQSGFIFTNPNATDTCGCGKSFSAGDCTPTTTSCH